MEGLTPKQMKAYENVALSDRDIMSLLNNDTNLELYPKLHLYHSIYDLLGPARSCVLLFASKPTYGHWTCIFERDGDLEFFDPYGTWPDDSLAFISPQARTELRQDYTYLSKLMLGYNGTLSYNQYHFQKHNPGLRTCGRHCVVRLLNRHLSLNDYKTYLEYVIEMYKLKDYDQAVTLLTS